MRNELQPFRIIVPNKKVLITDFIKCIYKCMYFLNTNEHEHESIKVFTSNTNTCEQIPQVATLLYNPSRYHRRTSTSDPLRYLFLPIR